MPSAPPPRPPLVPICLAKCDKLVSKCSAPQVESCRLNCTKYEPPPSECRDEVHAALECARDARDLTCANVAPARRRNPRKRRRAFQRAGST